MVRLCDIQVDTHVHSVLSGHAWSTLHEDVLQARRVGLKALCLTEHSSAVPGASPEWTPLSMAMIPEYDEGIRVYRGLEADVIDTMGTLCPRSAYLEKLDFCIASLHGVVCDFDWSRDKCTEAWLKVLDHPYIDALGHIDRAAFPCDFEPIVRKAAEKGKLIELNNASMIDMRAAGRDNVSRIARLCMQYGASVCVGSDAHYHTMVGDFHLLEPMLNEMDFPEELIVNRTVESFEEYRREKQNQIKRSASNAETDRTRLY